MSQKTQQGQTPLSQLKAPKLRYFSASAIQRFLECRQKYFLERVLKVTTPKREFPLDFGSAMEKGIQVLHDKNWDLVMACATFDQDYQDDPADTKRTRITAHTMLKRYKMAYEHQPFETVHNGFAFVLTVPELPGVQIRGEIDRIINWHGRIMVDEFKTTSQLTADYMKRFWIDYQTTIYLIAAKQIIDPKISAVLADAALVAKSDPKKLKSEPLLRDIIERSPDHLEYTRLRMVQIMKDMIIAHEAWESGENDLWYENDQSCTNYAGCKFLKYCRESPTVRESVLKTELVERVIDQKAYEKYEKCSVAEFKV